MGAGHAFPMTSHKTISYRGGIALFRLPSSWIEEYDPTGGGTFYQNGPDTGTLRINVMDFEKPESAEHSIQTAKSMLAGMKGMGEAKALPNGVAIRQFVQPSIEHGENLRIYTWQVGIWVTSNHFRLIVFTYTILDAQERDQSTQQELSFLDRSITEGEYPAVRGSTGD